MSKLAFLKSHYIELAILESLHYNSESKLISIDYDLLISTVRDLDVTHSREIFTELTTNMVVLEPSRVELQIDIEMPKCELEMEGSTFMKYLNTHDLNVIIQDKMKTWKNHVSPLSLRKASASTSSKEE